MKGRKRLITRFAADGANLGCVTAMPGEEAQRLGEGETWKEGVHDGRLNPGTGRVVKLQSFKLKRGANRIEGIPEGTKVIVNDELVEPVGGTMPIDVDHDEAVNIRLSHPLYEYAEIDLPCTPAGNRGGHKVHQDISRMRIGGYNDVASGADQRDAIIKVLNAILPFLPPEAIAAVPADALAVLEGIAAVKQRIPKKGQST